MSLFRIDKLFNFEKGILQSSKCTPGKYDFITASSEWKTHNEYSHDCEALIFAAAASGSLGRTHYVKGKFIASDLCFIITPKDPENYPIDLRFYHIIFNEFKSDIVKNTKAGTSKEAIGLGSFGRYELPYFGIDTQKEIKKRFVDAEETKISLSEELTHQLDLVKQLREAFLREAMQGKLVPQDATEEPASVLLQKIKAEKAQLIKEGKLKKEKELPPIKPDEIPFEIPKNWVWCRLGEITLYSEAGTSFKALETIAGHDEYGVIKTSAITSGEFIETENKKLPNQKGNYNDIQIHKGDLLFCRASGSKGLAGKSCLVKVESKTKLLLSDKSIRFVLTEFVNRFYFQYFSSSKYSEEYFLGLGTKKSTTMNNITREQFYGLTIPLPPLSEQHRIVAKLEQLMRHCDELEQSIKQSQTQNEQLLQQVLREALKPKSDYKMKDELSLAAEEGL